MAALTAVTATIAGLRDQIQKALNDDPVQVAGASAPPPAAGKASPAVDAGKPPTPAVDAGNPTTPSTGNPKRNIGVNGWYLAPSWGFGTPWRSASPNFANYANENIWSEGFLHDLEPFTTYRFLEWGGTNHSKVKTWAQRRSVADAGNREIYVDAGTSGVVPGIAYELMFDLAKRASIDIWVTLPMQADDGFIAGFAELAKRMLPAGQKLYVEWSNEPDGGWFTQTAQSQQLGAAAGLPGSNQYYVGAAYTTYRTLALRRALAAQFGADMGVRVFAARCGVGNIDLLRQSLTSVYKSAQWNPQNTPIDMLCMQGYFGNGRDGSTYTMAQAKVDIDNALTGGSDKDGWAYYEQMKTQFGIKKLGVYESGCHVLQNAPTFAAKPEAGQSESYLLDRLNRAAIDGPVMHYTDASLWKTDNGNGSWGLKTMIGGPDTAKSTAVKVWIVTHY